MVRKDKQVNEPLCPRCDGDGEIDLVDGKTAVCPICDGRGTAK